MANGSIRGTVRDDQGRPISGVTVQINITGAGSATIFQDRTGTPLTNPITNQADGSFEFFADTSHRYDLVFSATGVIFDNSDYVDMGVDMGGNNAVLAQHMAPNSVYTAAIQDLAVQTAKLDNNAVTATKLQSDASIDSNRAVTTLHIRNEAVETAQIDDNAVDQNKLQHDNAVDANRAVTTDSIQDKNVTEPKLADLSVSTRTIQAGAITIPQLGADVSGLIGANGGSILVDEFLDFYLGTYSDNSGAHNVYCSGNWGSTSGVTLLSAVSGHPGIARGAGIFRLQSYKVSNVFLGANVETGADFIINPSLFFSSTFIVAFDSNSSGFLVGFMDTPASDVPTEAPTNGIFFCKTAGGSLWDCITFSGGSSHLVTSGVTVGTGYHTLKMWRINAGTIGFSVDGGATIPITTHIPTVALYPVVAGAGGGTTWWNADYVSLNLGLTR